MHPKCYNAVGPRQPSYPKEQLLSPGAVLWKQDGNGRILTHVRNHSWLSSNLMAVLAGLLKHQMTRVTYIVSDNGSRIAAVGQTSDWQAQPSSPSMLRRSCASGLPVAHLLKPDCPGSSITLKSGMGRE